MIYDLVIKGGSIIDGSAAPAVVGDVAVSHGRIVEVGPSLGDARETIDARGLLVTPGFVDVHTHYDAQAAWDFELSPSGWHGVTTAVMGNCGVGFAPVRDGDRQFLIELMEGVEDIPADVLNAGLPWGWETYGDYLDVLDRIPRVVDIGGMVTHAATRLYVMGPRGADHQEAATSDEIATMGRVVAESLRAGALGFSTSRSRNHRTVDGRPISSLDCAPAELIGIAQAMRTVGTGVIEIAADFLDHSVDEEFELFRTLARESGRTVAVPLAPRMRDFEQHHAILDHMQRADDEGLVIRGQVPIRPVGAIIGLENRLNPFSRCPSYREVAELALGERIVALRSADRRQRILAEVASHMVPLGDLSMTFLLGDPLDYEPEPSTSIGAQAAAANTDPLAFVYDVLIRSDEPQWLYRPASGYGEGNFNQLRELLESPLTVPGLGDGGAHCTMIADASNPTTMLTHWARDRRRGEQLPLEWLIKRHTQDTAAMFGLNDRGRIAPGMKADCNLINFDALKVHPPRMVDDLPRGGRRLVQRADGYVATIVSGEVTYRDGVATSARPGRVVRQPR